VKIKIFFLFLSNFVLIGMDESNEKKEGDKDLKSKLFWKDKRKRRREAAKQSGKPRGRR
jgi:hypothetical protein